MNKVFSIAFHLLLLLLSVSACQYRPDYSKPLQMADSLKLTNPDSALHVLKSLENASWSNNPKEMPKVYFRLAQLNMQLHDIPQSLHYYKLSVETAKRLDDLLERRTIYSQAGNLYLGQTLHEQALNAYREAYKCDVELKDTAAILSDLRDIAVTYRQQNNARDALVYYQKASDVAQLKGDTSLNNMIVLQIAAIQTQLGHYHMAEAALEPLLTYLDSTNLVSLYSTAADYYYKTAQFNAADYYYRELLKMGNVYDKREAYGRLASMEASQNNQEEALSHMSKYLYWNDSIQKMTFAEHVAQTNALYNYQLFESENQQLKIKEKSYELRLALYGIFIGVVVVGVIFFYLLNRQKRLQLEVDLNKLKRVQDDLYRTTGEFLAERNKRVAELETQISELKEGDNRQLRLLKEEKEKTLMDIQQSETERAIKQQKEEKMLNTEIRIALEAHSFRGEVMNDKEWGEAQSLINELFPDFMAKLSDLISLNPTECKICVLLKLHFSNKDIATLISQTPASITMCRKRLYKKVFHKVGMPSEWDLFIRSL